MYILYADEAGNTGLDYDSSQQPIFTLGGIIIEDSHWLEMYGKIKLLKKEVFGKEEFEIHATEIFNGKKDKNGRYNFRQYTAFENRAFLERIIDFIVSEHLPIIYFPVRKSYLKRYCEYHYGSGIKIDPYLVAFPYVSSFFDCYLEKNNSYGLIMLDEQNALINAVDTAMVLLRGTPASENYRAKKIIERALFLNSEKNSFIQLADVCNYYINRYLSMTYGTKPSEDKKDHFQKIWEKMKPCFVAPPYDPYHLSDFSLIDKIATIDKK